MKTVTFSDSLSRMLTGKTGGSAAMLLNATGDGFTHGQQVGWHGAGYPLYSLKLADGRWVLAGWEQSGPNADRVMAQGLGFIDVCEWGTGKNMRQFFDEGSSQIIGTGTSLGLKLQLTYPTQWYPGQTYPGTATGNVSNPSANSGGGGGTPPPSNPGNNNPGVNLGSNFFGGGNSNTGGGNTQPMNQQNVLVLVLIIAAVGGLVYYLATKKK